MSELVRCADCVFWHFNSEMQGAHNYMFGVPPGFGMCRPKGELTRMVTGLSAVPFVSPLVYTSADHFCAMAEGTGKS